MTRAVSEWVATHDDQAIPKHVKARILLAYDGRCHKTNHKFRPGDRIEFDHIIALCNGGEHRERNIAPILGGKVHQAKTAEDVKVRAKITRIRLKSAGLWAAPRRSIQSRPFPKREERR